MDTEKNNATNKEENKVMPYRTLNMNTYIHDIMPDEMRDFRSRGQTKSGYANLDAITNLYPGFYVLGGISSLGKTTFAQQMGDQMAALGEHIIYFSLEQSALELASKSLSRKMCEIDAESALTSLDIRKLNYWDEKIKPAITAYSNFSNNINIIECSFRATINDIEHVVDEYVALNGIRPVVIIDYLQVIPPPEGSHMTDKNLIDNHVRRLKQLQIKHQIVLIAISSLNRMNYLTQVDYESFKESGGIEYTADVIWGLQLQILHDPIFDSQAKINEKRELVKKAKANNPRKVELVCLKNRFGISNYSCYFDYHSQFDFFKPGVPMDIVEKETKTKEFKKVPTDMEIPFN